MRRDAIAAARDEAVLGEQRGGEDAALPLRADVRAGPEEDVESLGRGGVEEAGRVETSVEAELPAAGECAFHGT